MATLFDNASFRDAVGMHLRWLAVHNNREWCGSLRLASKGMRDFVNTTVVRPVPDIDTIRNMYDAFVQTLDNLEVQPYARCVITTGNCFSKLVYLTFSQSSAPGLITIAQGLTIQTSYASLCGKQRIMKTHFRFHLPPNESNPSYLVAMMIDDNQKDYDVFRIKETNTHRDPEFVLQQFYKPEGGRESGLRNEDYQFTWLHNIFLLQYMVSKMKADPKAWFERFVDQTSFRDPGVLNDPTDARIIAFIGTLQQSLERYLHVLSRTYGDHVFAQMRGREQEGTGGAGQSGDKRRYENRTKAALLQLARQRHCKHVTPATKKADIIQMLRKK